jgi:hypothetical protein
MTEGIRLRQIRRKEAESTMAIVSKCTYDAQGRLIRPSKLAVDNAKTQLDFEAGEAPTFDRGFNHVFVLTASARTPDEARRRGKALLARFFDEAEFRGGRKIAINKMQGIVPCNQNATIDYEVLYAVEPPKWARRPHDPESPDVGSRRGRSATAQR